MPSASSVLSKTATACAVAAGVYAIIIGALLTPPLQRFALYAHKINTLFWQDVHDAEQFGFAKGQVTPFTIKTPDCQTLYAWHVLPVDTYIRNAESLSAIERPQGPVEDFTKTLPFELLSSTSTPARVVINFHGNAGHVAQGWRTDTYRNLALQPNTHVVTIDYRGFGHSTGSPTEAGLIADGTSLVNWVLHTARIPPENIVILGQSLGTAVSSAVALHFMDPLNDWCPDNQVQTSSLLNNEQRIPESTAFAGVILVAPFSSLPSLLLTYRLGGLIPILLPLRPFPSIGAALTSCMTDKWPTAKRLAAYYHAFSSRPDLLRSSRSRDNPRGGREMGTLQLIHAKTDMDISYHQTEIICAEIFGRDAARSYNAGEEGLLLDVTAGAKPRVKVQIVEHGGHNRIMTYSAVAIAVARAFGEHD
ncbi:hypothetical protein MBLNU13_g10145t1 [Cladosporium sp. NU13]